MADGTPRDRIDLLEALLRHAREASMAAHFVAELDGEDVIADGVASAASLLDGALDEIRRRVA